MDIDLAQVLALLIMKQDPESFFIPKEDFNIDLSSMMIGVDYDEERGGVVLFLVEKDEVELDDEPE